MTLDAPDLAGTLARPDGPPLVRAIIMHELAHVLGLDHLNDTTQLMHEENSGQFDFGMATAAVWLCWEPGRASRVYDGDELAMSA
ncbi:hypothetical protein [Pseudarthrobacter sp. Y6]|uniref:hypothetical protein n=1 Tax=Pseudarthrobacter sp. Y6 TaxID=3418422 RepID=UPI003CEEA6B7